MLFFVRGEKLEKTAGRKIFLFALLTFLLSLLLLWPISQSGATNVSGLIDADTTWTLSGSPYIVTGNTLVEDGVTLTIEPGVEVRFNPDVSLEIRGELIAQGTESSRITFTKNGSGDWGAVHFAASSVDATVNPNGYQYVSGSVIDYATIEYGKGIPTGATANATLRVEESNPYIGHSIFRHNRHYAVYVSAGAPTIVGNTMSGDGLETWPAGGIAYIRDTAEAAIAPGIVSNEVSSYAANVSEVFTVMSQREMTVGDNDVHHNVAAGDGFSGIYICGTAEVIDNYIYDNLAENGSAGLYLRERYTATPWEARGNIVKHNQVTGNGYGGIAAYVGTNLDGNLSVDNEQPVQNGVGFHVSNYVDRFDNNAAIGNTATVSSDGSGFHILGAASGSGNIVLGNSTSSSYGSAVRVDASGAVMTGGWIDNPGSDYDMNYYADQDQPDVDASNNYWGSTDTSYINSRIFDWLDDGNRGYVNTAPIATAPPSGNGDWSLSASSGQITLGAGESGDVTLTLAKTNPSVGSVRLVSSCPPGSEVTLSHEVTAPPSTVTATIHAGSDLAEGDYSVYFAGTDGNKAAAAQVELHVSAPPVVVINPQSPDPTQDSTPTFTGSATDITSNIRSIEYTLDDGANWYLAQAADGAFDAKSEDYTFTTTTLSDGAYTVKVRATDMTDDTTSPGNYASDAFTVDATAPAVFDLLSPADGSAANNTMPTFSWNAGADATSGLSKYQLYVDGLLKRDNIPANSTSASPASGLLSGFHTWYVKAIDKAGNSRQSTSTWTLFIDTSLPIVTVDPLVPDPSNDNTPTFAGAATDADSNIENVEYTLDDGANWYLAQATDGIFDEKSEDYTFTTTALSDSTYTVKVRATDIIGNVTSSSDYATDVFMIDTTAPDNPSVFSSSHALSAWSPINMVEVNWAGATDNLSEIDGYSYKWTIFSDTTPDDTKDCEETTVSSSSDALVDGDNWYFHIRTVDNAGNWSSSVIHYGPFYMDTTAPPAPTSVDDGVVGWSNDSTPTFNWSSSTDLSGIKGYWYAVDDETPETEGIFTTSTNCMLLAQGDGNHTFYVKAENGSGLISEAQSHSFSIDAASPSMPLVSSMTHPNGNTWYSNDNPGLSWTEPSDLSSISGYSYKWDQNPSAEPADLVNTTLRDVSFTDQSNGLWYFHVKAKDGAENWSATRHFAVRIDDAAPETFIDDGGSPFADETLGTSNVTLAFFGEDDQTEGENLRYSYKLEGYDSNWSAPSSSTSGHYVNLPNGTYTFHVKAIDSADNADQTPASRSFAVNVVANRPPNTFIQSGPSADALKDGNVTFTFYGDDDHTLGVLLQYSYMLAGRDSSWSPWTSSTSKQYTNLASGSYTFKVKARDANGFEDPTPAEQSFVILLSRPSTTFYFAEGYTGSGFQEYLTLQNPNLETANVTIEYSYRGGGGTTQTISVGPNTRETIDVNAAVGQGKEVSAKVTSDRAIIAERPMYFNFNGINGGHNVVGATSTNSTWYFAEGYTGSGFQEWLTLQNPNLDTANVTIEYSYRGGGGTTQTVSIGPNTRETVDVNAAVGSNKEVSAKVTSDRPIIAERPMYFNFQGINGGHNVVGANSPSLTFYFAEGYTGPGFLEYLTLQNPSSEPANVTIEYTFRGGGGTFQNVSVPANSRQTVEVNAAVGSREVSAKVTSDKPIIAERPMYFDFGGINGGHDVVGATNSNMTFYFAEGYTGSGFQEYLTLQNPNSETANVTIEYSYRGGGGTTQSVSIGPNTRETIDVNSAVGSGKEVSAKVTSDRPIIAERPMYFNFSGINGGHNVVGCPAE